MQSTTGERKRNQRKSPLTPKKIYKKDESPPPIPTRVGGRLKKAKIPFDPSPDAVNKRRQAESSFLLKKFPTKDIAPLQQTVCCLCKKNEKPEMLVHCKGDDCTTKIHLACLQSASENFGKNEELSWECRHCQTCSVCSAKSLTYENPILKCYICLSYFHIKCHGIEDKINILKENRFGCRHCLFTKSRKTTPVNPTKETVVRKARAYTQTRVKPVPSENNSNENKSGFLGFNANELNEDDSTTTNDDSSESKNIKRRRYSSMDQSLTNVEPRSSVSSENRNSIDSDTSIPDANEWSTDEVFKYFKSKFPKYAHVFKDHEIDGPSLYLLKRSDVIKGFNIKLGPALKIYGLILRLQTKCNDPTLSWQ